MKEVNLFPEIVFTVFLHELLIGEQFVFIYLKDTYCCMQREISLRSKYSNPLGSLLLRKFHAYYLNDKD